MTRSMALAALVAGAVAWRLVPHPWNLTPVGAAMLLSGAGVADRRLAFAVPLAVLFVTDAFVGVHAIVPFVYGSFAAYVLLGRWARGRSPAAVAAACAAGSVQFYLVTNFGMWAVFDTYPHTGGGLLACYVNGLPLLANTLAGDLAYTGLLFGLAALAGRATRPAPEAA